MIHYKKLEGNLIYLFDLECLLQAEIKNFNDNEELKYLLECPRDAIKYIGNISKGKKYKKDNSSDYYFQQLANKDLLPEGKLYIYW